MTEAPEPDEADEKDVTDQTRTAESDDEHVTSGPDREPTPEEEAVADAQPPLKESVAEAYEHQAKLGADIEGEGQVS